LRTVEILPQKTRSRVAIVKEKETKPMIVLASERGDIVDWVDKVTPMFDSNKTEVE
jgi:hypothetical protein